MSDFLAVALGLAHLGALIWLIAVWCRRRGMPWREWPFAITLLLWGAMVVAGYLLSPFGALNILPAYVVASFAALGILLFAYHASESVEAKTVFAARTLPVFTVLASPVKRRWLWRFVVGTLAVALIAHLIVCFSFYPVNADLLNYRLPRVFFYLSHGNLLHPFASADKRLTFYPVNGILLYVPLALYGVSSIFFSIPSLFAWMVIVYAAYRFARELGAERLIATCAAWLIAMTPSILVQASSTNDEILTAAPLLAGLYFFWRWLNCARAQYLFLAALGLGLCIGTKLHIFFLLPIMAIGFAWFLLLLRKRRESWRKYLPAAPWRAVLASVAVLGLMGPFFLILNYISSGQFYFLQETAQQVLNLGASLQGAVQNFIIYVCEMIFAPVADLNFWQSFDQRSVTNNNLNNLIKPLIAPFVSDDPSLYHLQYRFRGAILPVAVLLVEYGLWPGFAWMLWPVQAKGLKRAPFGLRPFFVMVAAVPVLWLAIWSCVTLYMEGVPTYFAFYMMCAAPAAAFSFIRAGSARGDKWRWAVLAFVALTNVVIDGNVIVNNVFRGLTNLTEDRPYPYDWLQFDQPIIDEIRKADRIQIPITHGKVYYFAFMHWNPHAHYYTPYEPAPAPQGDVLHVLSVPSEYMFGYIPVRVGHKPTPGITLLGNIRGVDNEFIFAFGNGIERRRPEQSNYILLHVVIEPSAQPLTMSVKVLPAVAGLNPQDGLEFQYAIKGKGGAVVDSRDWGADPSWASSLPEQGSAQHYVLTVSMRRKGDSAAIGTVDYPLLAPGAWKLAALPPR